jgi:multisubunit Na+/H+ antiporter MnhC subunit
MNLPAVGVVSVLFVAAAMVASGAFASTWRRDAMAAVAGIPLMLGGAGIALVGVARFAARATPAVQGPSPVVVNVSGPPIGQEAAVLVAVVSLALVAAAVGISTRGSRRPGGRQETSR